LSFFCVYLFIGGQESVFLSFAVILNVSEGPRRKLGGRFAKNSFSFPSTFFRHFDLREKSPIFAARFAQKQLLISFHFFPVILNASEGPRRKLAGRDAKNSF
jgi:hypothetical protein